MTKEGENKQIDYNNYYDEYRINLQVILNNFKNGTELYYKNVLFNTIVTKILIDGGNIYDFIEFLIFENERIKKEFEEYVKKDTRPRYGSSICC